MAEEHFNELGQPVGHPLPDWQVPAVPRRIRLAGTYTHLEPLDSARHAEALFTAYAEDTVGQGWSYLPYGPFGERAGFDDWLTRCARGEDPLFFTIFGEGRTGPGGVASYMRIMPAAGSLEIGHIHLAPRLQGTRAGTEALYLLIAHAFELGYRRVEWKCDALNAPSRRAALRLGFIFEGIFRQATVYKGRNRDTAWYAVIDRDWPALQAVFQCWLAPANFDEHRHQRQPLATLTNATPAG